MNRHVAGLMPITDADQRRLEETVRLWNSGDPDARYCRVCGGLLDKGSRRTFHVECQAKNKRAKSRDRREREAKLIARAVDQAPCPCCGKRIGKHKDRVKLHVPSVSDESKAA